MNHVFIFTGPAVFLGLAVEGPVFLFLFLKDPFFFRYFNGVQNSFTTMNHVFIFTGPAVFLRFGSGGSSFFKAPVLSFIYFNGGSEFIHNNESRIYFLQVHLFFLGLAVEGPVLFVKGSSFFRFFNGGPEFIHN